MSSLCRSAGFQPVRHGLKTHATWLLLVILVSGVRAEEVKPRIIRVASDPNNLPFSNDKLEGFENKIAALVGRELGAKIQYSWLPQRRGFFRQTLKDNTADLVMGAPTEFERALTTKPYYRSTYVFVTRKDRGLAITSFDDSRLKTLKIGVQLIGDDGTNSPPAHALARRGIVENVVGFTVYGDYAQPNPPARIVEAVAKGAIDAAAVWGPLGGYFAKHSTVPLEVSKLQLQRDGPLPMAFDISMGVRRQDRDLQQKLNEVIDRRRAEIDAILEEYGVPRLECGEVSSAK